MSAYGSYGNGYNNGYGNYGGDYGGNYNPYAMLFGSLGSSMFGRNPYNSGQNYLNQIPGTIQGSLNPYMQMGQNMMGPLQNQFLGMAQNPTANMQAIGSQYQQSPGYQFQVNQATDAADRSAASGGMVGTPANQAQVAGLATNLANQNYNQFMQNALGVQSQGLQGGMGLENQGFMANTDYANAMAQYYASQANQSQNAQNYKNQQYGGIFGALGSLL